MQPWWQTFFDDEYLRLWEGASVARSAEAEVEALWSLLGLSSESRVLDAPCGYGRTSRLLAERGASVVGVDYSTQLLQEAERRRGELSSERLRYRRHDLRVPLDEAHFDVALNLFSSLGYGSEEEDRAMLSTLATALRPGGLVFVELNDRDSVVLAHSRNPRPARRLPDGTLLVEEPRLDPLSGRIETTWYFSGPQGAGQKSASLRVYCATELAALLEASGFQVRSAHQGCSIEPFTHASPRLGLLAVRR